MDGGRKLCLSYSRSVAGRLQQTIRDELSSFFWNDMRLTFVTDRSSRLGFVEGHLLERSGGVRSGQHQSAAPWGPHKLPDRGGTKQNTSARRCHPTKPPSTGRQAGKRQSRVRWCWSFVHMGVATNTSGE